MAEFKTLRNNSKRGRSFGKPQDRARSVRSDSRSGGRSDNRRDLPPCDAVCAKCGKDCKVPFKPTANKPVYCSNCFETVDKTSSRDNRRDNFSSSNNNLDQINNKLDKILRLLEQSRR
jgi:CxxC-x17-CxxC domain-containing protein